MEEELWPVEENALDFFQLIVSHWPAFSLFIAAVFGVALMARALALTSESAAKFLGPVGRFFKDRQVILKGEVADLRERVLRLDQRVRALIVRDECYFDYMVYDASWHNLQELRAAEVGLKLEPHVSFLVFRDSWMRDHGLEKDGGIWT